METIIECYMQRISESDEGTFGILTIDELKFSCVTVELPWRENTPMISCIPADEYVALWDYSKRFKRDRYRLQNTSPRTGILIHPANFGGDKTKGWRCDLSGCIGLGERKVFLSPDGGKTQQAVSNSIATVEKFEAATATRNLRIKIVDIILPRQNPPLDATRQEGYFDCR